MENKKYIVVIDGYYVRDAQVLSTTEKANGTRHTEDELCDLYEQDSNWRDISHKDIYLGVYDWTGNKEELIQYVAKKQGYMPETLSAYEMYDQKQKQKMLMILTPRKQILLPTIQFLQKMMVLSFVVIVIKN